MATNRLQVISGVLDEGDPSVKRCLCLTISRRQGNGVHDLMLSNTPDIAGQHYHIELDDGDSDSRIHFCTGTSCSQVATDGTNNVINSVSACWHLQGT